MTTSHSHSNGNDSQSQPPEPAPANLLRYGDETGHDPATRHAEATIRLQRRILQLRWDDYARQLGAAT